MARYTNQELIDLARQRAREYGKAMPRTAADVERLTGYLYTGPNPCDIGKTFSVEVKQVK